MLLSQDLEIALARTILTLALALLVQPAAAQTVQIYSEFRRVDVKGEILPQDRAGKPREILSPEFVRNGFHSLRAVIRAAKGKWYTLHVSQNPEESLQVTIYREKGDSLELLKQPVQAQGTGAAESFWLDVFVPPLAAVRRVRLEVQLNDGSGWVIYPMEVRLLAAIVPRHNPLGAALPPPSDPADATVRQALREYLCKEKPAAGSAPGSMRELMRRNARQDIALARALEAKSADKEKLLLSIVQAAGGDSVTGWCGAAPAVSPFGTEWYLRVRDFIYREASR